MLLLVIKLESVIRSETCAHFKPSLRAAKLPTMDRAGRDQTYALAFEWCSDDPERMQFGEHSGQRSDERYCRVSSSHRDRHCQFHTGVLLEVQIVLPFDVGWRGFHVKNGVQDELQLETRAPTTASNAHQCESGFPPDCDLTTQTDMSSPPASTRWKSP